MDRLPHTLLEKSDDNALSGESGPSKRFGIDLAPRDPVSYPVQIHTLGSFALLRRGAWVSFGTRMRKPVLLLQILIALGGRNVAKRQVIDLLWPDAEGDAAQRVFITTLHRLRRLIGFDAVASYGVVVSLNLDCCWVDSWAFEAQLEQAPGLSPVAYEARLQQAIKLYQGHFLPAHDESWSIALRERLSRKFVQAISTAGHYLEVRRSWVDACLCYERGLEVEPIAEELYQRLMICYGHLGQRAQMLRVYERCQTTLAAFLGITPSEQTQALYRTLLKT